MGGALRSRVEKQGLQETTLVVTKVWGNLRFPSEDVLGLFE